MLGGNKRKMKNQGGNQRNMNQQNRAGGNNNNRANNNFNNTNFNNSQQQQLPQMGYVDFSSNFNDQQVGRQNNNQNNGKPFRKNNMKGGNNQGRMQNNNNNKNNNVRNQNGNANGGNGNSATTNFQTANGGNNPHNWNMRRAQTNDNSNNNMMQQNQQQPFNPPPPLMNQRMPNFNRNMRGGNRGPFNGGGGGGPPMRRNFPMPPIPNGNFMPNGGGNGPMPPMQFNRQMMRPRFPNRNNNTAATNKTRKNPNLSKVDKPKNRKQQNLNKKNANAAAAAAGGTTAAAATTTTAAGTATGATKNRNKVKRQQNRDQYPMTAAFVTDEIREEFEKKEKVLAELTGKGKNDELFAKFKEQRDIFVKMYDVAKAANLVKVAAEKALRKVSNKQTKQFQINFIIFNNYYFRLLLMKLKLQPLLLKHWKLLNPSLRKLLPQLWTLQKLKQVQQQLKPLLQPLLL